MPSKQIKAVVLSPDVRTGPDFGEADRALAVYMGVDISASANVRTEKAVFSYNVATRYLVEAGLLLASVKAEISHVDFLALLLERGLAKERAYELMRGASFVARIPDAQREQILAMDKTKVLALASADHAVVQAMLEDGEIDISAMGVRDLRQKLRDAEAALADKSVQLDTAENELEVARKRLAKAPGERDDKVPMIVADLRADIVALVKKAELSIASIDATGVELVSLAEIGWADPTLRFALAGLVGLQLQLDGVVNKFIKAIPDAVHAPVQRSYLTSEEALSAAQTYAQLTALHTHEKHLRDWDAKQARPRGKGRPEAKPEAPSFSK